MISPYEIIEIARKTGKIDKGVNEVTKAIERVSAKLVVYAEDVSPKEIVQHLPVLCQEKGIVCQSVESRKKLGISAGIGVSCTAVAVIEPGDATKALIELGIKLDPERKKERPKK